MRHSAAWGIVLLTGILVVLTILVLPLVAAAQRPSHIPRIAVLGLNFPQSASEPPSLLDAFRHGLRKRGWVEGHTIVIEWRWAEGSLEQLAILVTELVRLPVEVLVVPNAQTAKIAKVATTTIPIVVTGAGDLLTNRLVASLARPGGTSRVA